jgi:predicted GIY-YIG superfamily endonuclease
MLYYVYVLKNKDRYYVGLTSDVEGRYKDAHLVGNCKSSAKLGDPKDLELIHYWESPGYMLASKLERALHRFQKQLGEDIVLTFIEEMPIYTKEYQDMLHHQLLSTKYEEQREDQED